MKALLLSRITLVWMALVASTMLSWALGHGLGFQSAWTAGAAIIVVTFVKVRFVVMDFMEICHAPRWMRRVGDVWIVLTLALLIYLFLSAAP